MKLVSLKSIQLRIALWTGACLVLSGMVNVAYVVTIARATALRAAEERCLAESRIQAGMVKAKIEILLGVARARAQELMAIKQPENPLIIRREQVNAMMRQVLIENPQYLGVWSLWEPNAFDGKDALYANTEAYGKTGRCFPYWNRGTGTITVEPLINYDTDDWYQVPKKTRQEYVTDLFTYPIMGKDTWMVSVAVPIVVHGEFYGVAGQDIPVAFLQELADRVDIYGRTGKLLLIGSNGKLVAATGRPELRGRPLSDVINPQDAQEYLTVVQAGQKRVKRTHDHVEAIVPIYFGRMTKPWAALILLPSGIITAPANVLMWRMVGISSLLILAGFGALWLLAGEIAHPIQHVAQVTRRVAAGDLTQTVTLGTRSDELGMLSQDFNRMTQQLRSMYDTLDRRVAERTADLASAKERAEVANRAKTIFLANMSHELRTPLNAVLGFSELMQADTTLSESQKENLSIIKRSGTHLLGLINDVLEISRIEAGRVTREETSFDLWNTLETVKEMMRSRSKAKGLSFILERDSTLPRYVKADERKLKQVILNLAGNAVKFTQQGKIILRAKGENEGTILRFEVEDTGPGIDAPTIPMLFESFAQGHQQQEGAGLGLFISRKLVEFMGGQITVQSELGKGSVFSFDIHCEAAACAEIAPTVVRGVVSLAPGQRSPRILVAEDILENRLLMTKLLRSRGFEVMEAVDGAEAVQLFEERQPDLVLMDMRMPVMDGYESIRRIRSTQRGKTTPIIAVTASAFEEDRQKILAIGADDFIRKPVQGFELFEKIRLLLNIAYIYTGEQAEVADVVNKASLGEMVGKLPEDLTGQLVRAITTLDLEGFKTLLPMVAQHNPHLADQLKELVDGYQMTELAELFQQRSQGP